MAGPAWSAAAMPVIENNPAPMTTPIPSAISAPVDKVFFIPCLSEASAMRLLMLFFVNNPILPYLLGLYAKILVFC